MKKKFNWIWVLIIVVLLIYGSFSVIYNYILVEEVIYEPIWGGVKYNGILLDINKSDLTMGHISPGHETGRTLYFYNNKDYDLFLTIKKEGNIKNFIEVSPNKFLLKPAQNQTVEIAFSPSYGSVSGDYEGNLKIIVRRLLW